MTTAIDLDAYSWRIGYEGPRFPTLPVLSALIRAHTQTIPFENLDPLLERTPKLDPAALEAKLVRSRRGGYCFEHNTLFQHVLRALGFEVRSLGARVLLNQPADAIPSRTHMLLTVEAEGRTYLTDVGFGGLTPTGPLPFSLDTEHPTPHERYRIMAAGPEYELLARVGEAWERLYRFHLIEHFAVDHEVSNHYIVSRRESMFRSTIVAARATPGGRHLLRNRRLAFQHVGGDREEHSLPDADALISALDNVFGIDVPDRAAIAEVFARVGAA